MLLGNRQTQILIYTLSTTTSASASVSASTSAAVVGKDISALLERATELENMGNKVIAEFHNHSKSHLVEGLNHEVHNLQRIAAHLKNLTAANETVRTHELNYIEEELLHFENRFNEELEIALEVCFNIFPSYFAPIRVDLPISLFANQSLKPFKFTLKIQIYHYNATGKSADELINYGNV